MNSPDDVAAVNAVNALNAADTTDATDATDAAAVAAIAVNAASVPSVISNDVLSNDVPSNDIPRDNDKSEVEPVNRNTNANLTSQYHHRSHLQPQYHGQIYKRKWTRRRRRSRDY